MKISTISLAFGLVLAASGAHAHVGHHGSRAAVDPLTVEQHAFGRAGDPDKATHTIHVVMDDRMRFTPAEISVNEGDIVKFVVSNRGGIMHELVLGTREELLGHAEMMRKFPGMEHDEAHMAHVAPGNTETLVWHFNRAGEFEYGCLIPGHFEAGMVGRIKVKAAATPAAR